jgi:hypothetical protein
MRLGSFEPEGNKYAPIFTQLQLTFFSDDALAAATLAACSAALFCSIKDNTLCLVASTSLLHKASWMEVAAARCKMMIDAVGISAVPRKELRGQFQIAYHTLFCVRDGSLFFVRGGKSNVTSRLDGLGLSGGSF